MADNITDIIQKAANIRKSFDETFASPPPEPGQALIMFALIVAGGNRYALRMRDLAGVVVKRKVVPVPTELPGVLGVSAVEGQLVTVIELAALFGGSSSGAPLRWIALYRATELIGLAFEDFQRMFRVSPQAVHAIEAGAEHAQFCPQAIQVDSALIHVLELPTLLSTISLGNRTAGQPAT